MLRHGRRSSSGFQRFSVSDEGTLRMTTVAIIPARYGSARIPGKPLALIAGKPMIQHVVERARQAALVDRVLVATDDERIRDTVEAFGGTAVMTSVALQSGSDRIASAAQLLPDASIIVNVQGDEPLIDPRMIDQAIRPLLEDPVLPAATLIRAITSQEELLSTSFPKVVIDRDGNCLYFSRSVIPFLRDTDQSAWLGQHTFYRHIGLYVFQRPLLHCCIL